jgi:hypothetical protein
MSQQDVQIIRGGYDAFNRQDIPGVLERFDPQVEWVEPGGGRAPVGTFRGSQGVAEKSDAGVDGSGPLPDDSCDLIPLSTTVAAVGQRLIPRRGRLRLVKLQSGIHP